MMVWIAAAFALTPLAAVGGCQAPPLKASDLRLVPFPKQVQIEPGRFRIEHRMMVAVSDTPAARQAAADLAQDLSVIEKAVCDVTLLPSAASEHQWLFVSPAKVDPEAARRALDPLPDQTESYGLIVSRQLVAIGARDNAGLVWGIQALRQLVRANAQGRSLPCLSIDDWPSLRYRGFQDDLTRGESSTLPMLESEVRLGSLLKMNFWTYYMENQYAFQKHPDIGPAGGSLLPEELRTLVDYAGRYNVEVVGNQQSFGHMEKILDLPAYKELSETPGVLDPTNEATYQLLNDLYSEVAPLTSSTLFNACCDEVWSLGTGRAKPVADRIGVGALYAQHMRRVHDLLKDKYGKRMMMWGDIIGQHPESLKDIPKDTVMLAWNYDALPSFDNLIKPFADAGYDFFVCPGVSCWFRILPVFDGAVGNIQGFVRDGAKHGALGMLNTSWDDGAENLFNCNWHGVAWGAECAWNASTTSIDDFDRRIGGVLFGEPGDHFGQAIKLLGKTHTREFEWMSTPRFWQHDTLQFAVGREVQKEDCRHLLTLVDPALEHLRAAKKDAKFNAYVLDYFIFGAQRIKLLATRMLRQLEAGECYEQAGYAIAEKKDPKPLVQRAVRLMKEIRSDHAQLKPVYCKLYLAENRPYSLDWLSAAYDDICGYYDGLIGKLEQAQKTLAETGKLPPAREVGLEIVEKAVRRTRPHSVTTNVLLADAPWAYSGFRKRLGLVVQSGDQARQDQPIEVDLPRAATPTDVVLSEVDSPTGAQQAIPCQVETAGDHKRLIFLAPAELPVQGQRSFLLYFDPTGAAAGTGAHPIPDTASCSDAKDGMKWVENGQFRLLIGPEGGHIYRWEVKAQGNRDITQPGETQWQGFADVLDQSRFAPNTIEVLSNGPALVRVKCTNDVGLQKVISVWAGAPWVEVTFNRPAARFACFDDAKVLGPESATPGTYLFSDGETGPVKGGKARGKVSWAAKYVPGGLLEALITPEESRTLAVGPGGGDGGLMMDGDGIAHFAIYGGVCTGSPKDTLDRLRTALDLRAQPSVELYGVQSAR